MRKHGTSDLCAHPDAYITPLNVSDKTVRKWIKAGVLTASQFQGESRIRTADAVAFVDRARFQV
jgi:hypothetical protein